MGFLFKNKKANILFLGFLCIDTGAVTFDKTIL